jgi:hypothetical protein
MCNSNRSLERHALSVGSTGGGRDEYSDEHSDEYSDEYSNEYNNETSAMNVVTPFECRQYRVKYTIQMELWLLQFSVRKEKIMIKAHCREGRCAC